MNIFLIRKELAELNSLIENWDSEVSTIERDIALDKLKNLYQELRFMDSATVEKAATEPQDEEPEIEVELTYYEGDDEPESDEPESEEPIISIDLNEKISIVADLDIEEIPQEIPQETPQETTKPKESINALFDIETIPVRQKSRRSAILSLYNDTTESKAQPQSTTTPSQQPDTEEIHIEEIILETSTQPLISPEHEPKEVAPIETPTTTITIADTLSPKVETIAERYAAESSTSTLCESQSNSSINDRYLISQNLFGGNMEACDEMLAQLNMIDNFDDTMIFIVENYDWNPDDEATKLVVKSMELKFSQN